MADVTVSEPVAIFFFNQVAKERCGEMAMVPNNPILFGLMQAHSIDTKEEFARFLRQVADQLTKDQPF